MSRIGWGSKYKALYDRLLKSSLQQMHLRFGNGVVFSCEATYRDQAFIHQRLEDIRRSLITPEEILAIRFDNVEMGDLIYDTYLRYFHQPTIESVNEDVLKIIEIALNVFYNFEAFLRSNRVCALLNTYSSYIEHGITARICLTHDIPVYTIGSYSYLIQKLERDFPYHQINHTHFSPDRELREDQIAVARERLTSRLEGKIDAATHYMRQSAYTASPTDDNLRRLFAARPRNIVIYVHDFYDSPHVNRRLQFPDLYQFLKQTLAVLTDLSGTTVFIKPHPNGMEGCKEKTIELVGSFQKDHFHVLEDTVTNLNIIDLKPDLIATARGTICIEMAYVGIPTVALFDNLYANFKFTHTCADKEEYFAILRGEKQPSIDFDKQQILKFYYQAHLEQTRLKEHEIFTVLAAFKGDTYNDQYLEHLLSGPYAQQYKSLVGYYAAALDCLEGGHGQ